MQDDSIGPEVDDILEGIPQEERKAVKHMLSMTMQMAHVTSPQAELMKKITSDNISEIVELQNKEMDLEYKESRDRKVLYFISMIVIVIVIFGIIVLLKNNPDVMKEVLISIVSMIIGSIGGYGIGKSHRNE